jgi:pimeloyl-ACP methyl ester carboxylesterase
VCGEGPIVLCLHGFPDHARSFEGLMAALAAAGHRAIAPMMRGYEPSSQPADGDYEVGRMAEDVVAWLDELGAPRAHLVGHDWGAVVAYAAGAMAPDRFRSLTTLAISHPGRFLREGIRALPSQLRRSWYMAFFQLRGIADWSVERDDWSLIRRLWRDWSPGYEMPAEDWDALVATMSAPGVKRAMLGYYRSNLSPRARTVRSLREVPVPTLAITGARDGCMDTRLHDLLMRPEDFPAGLEVERIDDAGHFVHLERPDRVASLVLDWLGRRNR